MKVCMVTDWYGEVLGGISMMSVALEKEFKRQGYHLTVLHPRIFQNEIHKVYKIITVVKDPWTIKEKLEKLKPDLVFILGEKNLSAAAVTYCRLKRIPYLTFYQTCLPDLALALYKLPKYHYKATNVLSISDSMTRQLIEKTNVRNIKPWFGGVNTESFNPGKRQLIAKFNPQFESWPKPILLCVSRASAEKNLEAFMSIKYPGTKIFLGDGPLLNQFKEKYPETKCLGPKTGDELAAYYAAADCFIFSSKSDAFGMVNIEALASGTPVVGFNASGIRDILEIGVNGYLADDEILENSIAKALRLDRGVIHKTSFKWSIEQSVKTIVANGELIGTKRWGQVVNPTLTTLLSDFKLGVQLMAFGFYYYILYLLFSIFNDQGIKDSFGIILYCWYDDLKKILFKAKQK